MTQNLINPNGEVRPERTGKRMTAILFVSSTCLLFAVAQLHLQFAMDDLRHETIKLQERKMELRSQINSLRGEVESQKKGDNLLQFAQTELGMVRYPPSEWERLTIPADIQARYAAMSAASLDEGKRGDSLRKDRSWINFIASKLGFGGKAFADEANTIPRMANERK